MELNKKTKKAITPVIALVMLLLITVGITGASYSWFGGLMSSQTKKPITIPPGGAYCADGDIKVYALNNGDAAITTQDIIVAQVDGVDVKGTPFFGDMRSGLVGYWKFDEAGGTTARDSSGNNNNGDLKPACPNCPEWKTGRSRNALNFDGVNDYVDVDDSSGVLTLTGTEVTITGWLNARIIQDAHAIGIMTAGSQTGYELFVRGASSGFWAFGVGTSVGGWTETYYDVSTNGAALNQWVYLAGTYDGSNIKLYINGALAGSAPKTGNLNPSSTDFRIGRSVGYAAYFNGLIDEVKIYNKAVGEVNIQPSSSGLILNYPGTDGKHTVRIGTPSGVAETGVTC